MDALADRSQVEIQAGPPSCPVDVEGLVRGRLEGPRRDPIQRLGEGGGGFVRDVPSFYFLTGCSRAYLSKI